MNSVQGGAAAARRAAMSGLIVAGSIPVPAIDTTRNAMTRVPPVGETCGSHLIGSHLTGGEAPASAVLVAMGGHEPTPLRSVRLRGADRGRAAGNLSRGVTARRDGRFPRIILPARHEKSTSPALAAIPGTWTSSREKSQVRAALQGVDPAVPVQFPDAICHDRVCPRADGTARTSFPLTACHHAGGPETRGARLVLEAQPAGVTELTALRRREAAPYLLQLSPGGHHD